MKKWFVAALLVIMTIPLTSCVSARRTLDTYNTIGSISLSDDRFLTKEERREMEDLRDRREAAYQKKDVNELIWIRNEWEEFKAPRQMVLDRYEAVKSGLFTTSELELLTKQEKESYNARQAAVKDAYEAADLEKINQELDDLYGFYDYRKQVFDLYAGIDQSPVSDNLRKFVPSDDLSTYDRLKKDTEKALKNRDSTTMAQLKNDWSDFRSVLKKDIADAQDQYLRDAMAGADFAGALFTLLSFGTIRESTELQGHTIIYSVQYMSTADDKQISKDLDNYLASMSSYFESYVKNLKKDVSDARIRVEYKNRNGRVVSSREFQ